MKYILLIFTFVALKTLCGQTAISSYPMNIVMSDTLTMELVDIENTPYSYYFRFYKNGQTVDIYLDDEGEYHGTVTNWIKEYDQVKIDDDYHTEAIAFYSEQVPIESSQASSIAIQINATGQPSIPTDSLIESWKRWYLHCGSLTFEIKYGDHYNHQTFHCPWSQPDSVPYAKTIVANNELINNELKLDSLYQHFMTQLPKGKTYSRDGYRMTYRLSEEEEKAWKTDKPRRDYLKSIKDTVDRYLNSKINNALSSFDLSDISCYDGYHLTFGKNGKLKKIWTNPEGNYKLSDGLSWYLEDRMEMKRCYKQVKRIFRKVDLRSFDLKYEVYRTFYFEMGDDEWMLIDDTVY